MATLNGLWNYGHSVAQQSGDDNATQRQAPLRYSLPGIVYGAAGEGEKKI
nr:hypothetical protein [Ralstonia sp. LMG 19083]